MSEEMLDENVIELENEDGTKDKFYHLATLEYKESMYGIFELAEPQTEEDEGAAFVFSMEEDGEDVILNEVEDEEIADAVFNLFLEQTEGYEEE